MRLSLLSSTVFAMTMTLGGQPTAEARGPRPPLVLRAEMPSKNAIQYRSGWRLAFRMSPRTDDYTLAMDAYSAMYPPLGLRSFFVFRDLDGCLDALENNDCPSPPGDELVFPFTPDQDTPGVLDSGADQAIRDIHTNYFNGPFFGYGFTIGFGFGPFNSGVADGIGYGPNDDMPGFVLLSNVGAGRVLQVYLGEPGADNPDGFTEMMPLQRRNLAGLMTDVSFELLSGKPKPKSIVRTSVIVPPHLFAQYRIIDFCVGGTPQNDFLCEGGGPEERVEGSSERVPSNRWDDEFSSDPNLISTNVSKVELRAFVVEGQAPVFIEDCNLDDRVNAADAECMGHNLLSNEVVLRFTQMGNHEDVCAPSFTGRWQTAGTWLEVDFDGNGMTPGFMCPSGGGRISVPPR